MKMSNLAATAAAPTQQQSQLPQQPGELFKGFSAISSRLTDRLKEGGLDNLISGVKNFLPQHKDLVTTRIIEALMDPNQASSQALQDTDDYLVFDPRSQRGPTRAGASTPAGNSRTRQTFNDAVVFVVGGGSYVEFSNLQEYAQRSSAVEGAPPRRITYGSTEIATPKDFLASLSKLA